MSTAEVREETRVGIEENCPPGARGSGQIPFGSRQVELEADTALWLERMAEKGWTVPTWPKAYGGAGLERDHYEVLIDELKKAGARTPLTGRGVNYIGPTILEFGTDAQKQKWLPICARGEGAWAMGYSEPGAGSDLASLNTRAVRDGDRYLLNGSKMWTSDATLCDYIFVLVRTSPEKPKHEGITLMLVDMHQPGVKVSPIQLISGASPFFAAPHLIARSPFSPQVRGGGTQYLSFSPPQIRPGQQSSARPFLACPPQATDLSPSEEQKRSGRPSSADTREERNGSTASAATASLLISIMISYSRLFLPLPFFD